MTEQEWWTEQFERNRAHLGEVARRILGSRTEADDAVQEAWLRLSRSEPRGVENMRAWLTTVVSRICLDMLRRRQARREESLEDWLPESIVLMSGDEGPEHEALIADSVGVALLVVLETLSPVERLAFVLHDMFGLAFEEIAPIVDRSVPATRQLASRARRRVRGVPGDDAGGRAADREVVEAFLAAARGGDFAALVAVLDPDVVFRGDGGTAIPEVPGLLHGAEDVARLVLARGTPTAPFGRPALIDGQPGAVVILEGRLTAVVRFRIEAAQVREMDLLVDPERLRQLRITA